MAAFLDPSRPFSAELCVIRRLNSSLYGTGGRGGLEPTSHPPVEKVTLAPSRDDVSLLDPCCGQLSAGAEVDLGVKGRHKFIDFNHVASALRVPPGFRERLQTASNPSSICVDLSEDKAWNSRRIPDAVLRARLNEGSAGPVKGHPHSLTTSSEATSSTSYPDKHTVRQGVLSPDLRPLTDDSAAVRHFRYTSATQRSYEDVGWDAKLPRRLKPPETTLEKMADPVSERPSSRRYASRPELWQSVGAEWNRRQLRSRSDARKPVSFCSGCPRSGQIPLYTGAIGSENMDDIDDADADFRPLTLRRSVVPPYTPTARRTTIPGYTGKALYVNSAPDATGPAHPPSGVIKEWAGPAHRRAAPLSRTVTTMTPCNPFLRPALPASRTSTRGDVRQSR